MSDNDPTRETNRALALKYFEHQAAGNFQAAMDLIADDASWWVPGQWEMGGTYTKAQMMALFQGDLPFAAPLTYRILATTSDKDRVAVELEAEGPLKDGRTYRNDILFLFVFKDGRIVGVKEYVDTLNSYRTFIAPPPV